MSPRKTHPTRIDLAVYWTFLLGGVLSATIFIFLIWRRRKLQPLKARLPWLYVLDISLRVAVYVFSMIQHIIPQHLNCSVIMFTQHSLAYCSFAVLFLRMFLCVVAFEYNTKIYALKTSGNVELALALPITQRPWILWIHHIFSKKWTAVICGIFLGVNSVPMAFHVFVMHPEIMFTTRETSLCRTYEASLITFRMVLACLGASILSGVLWRIRKVNENFWLKKEFMYRICLWPLTACIYWTIQVPAVLDVILNGVLNWIPVVLYVLPTTLLFYVILVVPYRRTFKKYTTGVMITENADASHNKKNNREILTDILHNDQGFQLILEFSVREFSSENLMFWSEATDFMHNFSSMSSTDIQEAATRIFNTFIVDDGPLCINIVYETRDEIIKAFESNSVHGKVFVTAIEEVFDLIRHDTFRRFKYTDTYRSFMTQLEERQRQKLPLRNKLSLI